MARVVIFLCHGRVLRPKRTQHLLIVEQPGKGPPLACIFNHHFSVDLEAALGSLVHEFVPPLKNWVFHQLRVASENSGHRAVVLRMIRHNQEVEGTVQLHPLAGG